MSSTIKDHVFYVQFNIIRAKEAALDGDAPTRRARIERALWHRSEVRRLKKLVASRAAGMKTA